MTPRVILAGLFFAWVASSLVIARRLFPTAWEARMEPIGQLLTGIDQSFRTAVLVPLAIVALLVIGGIWMLGNQRTAQERATAFAIGLALILGAPRIVTWIQGIVH